MGLAVDPGYPTRPYVYVLYAYNHIIGDASPAPRWPSADALVPPGSKYDDRCPNPPQATVDGCVVSGRLLTPHRQRWRHERQRARPDRGLVPAVPEPLGRQPRVRARRRSVRVRRRGRQLQRRRGLRPARRHAAGHPDAGQPVRRPGRSRTRPRRRPRVAPSGRRTCGRAATRSRSTARSSGSIPTRAPAWPDNATAGASDANARRIIAYGLRNPFRFTIKPGTNEMWIGDVGFNTWEELNRLVDADAAPRNFGWPCYEGGAVLPAYAGLGLSICNNLTAGEVTLPYYTYNHQASVVAGDGCSVGSSSISGLAFLPATSPYPAADHGALFMTDYSRRCIWELPAGSNGLPDVSARRLFANLKRPSGEADGGSVFLAIGPTGDLIYADYDRGEIRRIHYYGANVPPVPSFTATPVVRAVAAERRLRCQRLHRRRTATRSPTPGTSTATASTTTRPGSPPRRPTRSPATSRSACRCPIRRAPPGRRAGPSRSPTVRRR